MGQDFFYEKAERTTRRDSKRRCYECRGPITAGQKVVDWACVFEGNFTDGTTHSECRAAANDWIAEQPHYVYQDGWPGLENEMADSGERDAMMEWLREKHPGAAERFTEEAP